jgi:hypothetical protein
MLGIGDDVKVGVIVGTVGGMNVPVGVEVWLGNCVGVKGVMVVVAVPVVPGVPAVPVVVGVPGVVVTVPVCEPTGVGLPGWAAGGF